MEICPLFWKFVCRCPYLSNFVVQFTIGKGIYILQYKDMIIQLINKIHDEKTLKRIYKFVLYLYTHETD